MSLPKGLYSNDYPDPDSRCEQEVEDDHQRESWAEISRSVVFGVGRVARLTPERIAELKAMPYTVYLTTPEWRTKRQLCLEDAGHRCERCSARGTLHVHHTTYERLPMELRGDLRVLCPGCHLECHPDKAPKPEKVIQPFRIQEEEA